ncbi:MAG: Fe-S-binding domain-containing protein, partial [Gemmatimonadetes bacterium]|nr:Fe-S-binding domain-containing protein [Gemmatimonadota bacterium]NIR41492.1 Fe-S-binding domain-containing protein [Actinomycetota bacterium]NIS36520.1 Fe-S-binding domain-containing protein [Actinomycetota bacterium]NIT98751.1 Fe-S-binding domain-containing protein [Actinomycetota bacterium]NIU71021.1 Fe-S-binding domain-containing protein [Actinomycetota bacterium]
SRALAASCVRPAEDGMRIHTDTDRVREARRGVLELLDGSVSLDRSTLGVWMERYRVRPGIHAGGAAHRDRDPRVDNDLYVRDMARCVLCYRCVEACGDAAQHTYAITVAGRGFDATIAVEHDRPLTDSACVFCGNCIAVCPTGALMFRSEHELRAAGAWDPDAQTVTRTVCPYCGVGCNLELTVQAGRIVRVGSPADHDVSSGNLCVKGRFGYDHVQELDEPLRTPID